MESETSLLFRVRKTINQLLLDRGYLLSSDDLSMTINDFKSRYGDPPSRDKLTVLAAKKDDPKQQLFVFFSEEEKLGVKPIKHYVVRMEKESIHRAILVLKKGITPFARRIVTELAQQDPGKSRHIELFEENELLVNITQHVFVPQHVLLTPEEKQALLVKYKLKDNQLPRIQQIDPVARYYGLTRGQVVKIVRPSETAGRYVTYRLVY